jgi:hypothetical protein
MIRRDPDGYEREFQAFVDVDISGAERGALEIGGYWMRHPAGIALRTRLPRPQPDDMPAFLSPAVAAGLVWNWTRGAVVIGCTVNFDTETLAPMLLANGLEPEWDYHILDATTYAAGYLRALADVGEPGNLPIDYDNLEPPYKSTTIAAMLNVTIPPEDRHTALGDARLALRMFDAVTL